MKIYFMRDENKNIIGAQVVITYTTLIGTDNEEKACEAEYVLETNQARNGLWINGSQRRGTCDFDLCCSERTAKKRLLDYAMGLRPWNAYKVDNEIITSEAPLFVD